MLNVLALTLGTLLALLFMTAEAAASRDANISPPHLDIELYRSKFNSYEFVFQEEARFHLQKGITLLRDTHGDKSLRHQVIFAVQQKNLDSLTDILIDVSSPSSANYGKHWTRAQIAELTSNPLAASEVSAFLETHDIEVIAVSRHHNYITASATLAQWEVFFRTEFHVFHDKVHELFVFRALEHSLPSPLAQHVMGVFGVSDYFVDLSGSAKGLSGAMQGDTGAMSLLEAFAASNQQPTAVGQPWCLNNNNAAGELLFTLCGTYPQLLYAFYGVSDPIGSSLTSQAIFGSLDQSFSPTDLRQFQMGFNLSTQPTVAAYNGHVYNNACFVSIQGCNEASLDVQYVMAMAQGVPTYYDYVAQSKDNAFLKWIMEVADMETPADVVSISYSAIEQYQSQSTLNSFNVEAQKLGIAGVTIIVASGDNGAPGSPAYQDASKCGYSPTFPSVSPFVTSVGGTQGPEAGNEEVACQVPSSSITSSGGFSMYPAVNSIQSWQQSATSQYLALKSSTLVPGYGTGRGYPDVSMMSNNYAIIANRTLGFVSGTSASAPVFAGVISLVNSLRKETGKPALGFVNPLLYGSAKAFVNDITVGNNACTKAYAAFAANYALQYVGTCCLQQYFAATGWDPITGLGSVDVKRFLKLVHHMSSDDSSSVLSAGAIAGIVVGCLVTAAGFGAVLFYFFFVKKKPFNSTREDLSVPGHVEVEYTAL